MPAALLEARPYSIVLERTTPVSNDRFEKPTIGADLGEFIDYFDSNWMNEGLPRDWHTLRNGRETIGFSMNKQMALLNDAGSDEAVWSWARQTKQDIIGFNLEYLSDHLVYPTRYAIDRADKPRIVSRSYNNKEMIDCVSIDERGGSVRQSLIEAQNFFLSPETPDGSMVVITSPMGETGLRTDSGEAIRYPDSYFFVMQKNGESIDGFTLKTSFNMQECREAIYQLSGRVLPVDAPVEDYVSAIAKINPDKSIKNASDFVRVLQTIRPEFAFESQETNTKASWDSVYEDIASSDRLYDYNEQTTRIISDFEIYCMMGGHTRDDLQKATAATLLRLSELFYLNEESKKVSGDMIAGVPLSPVFPTTSSFGMIFHEIAKRPGCAGGGLSSTSVDSLSPLHAFSSETDKYGSLKFECPTCKRTNTRDRNQFMSHCRHCGSDSVSCKPEDKNAKRNNRRKMERKKESSKTRWRPENS